MDINDKSDLSNIDDGVDENEEEKDGSSHDEKMKVDEKCLAKKKTENVLQHAIFSLHFEVL